MSAKTLQHTAPLLGHSSEEPERGRRRRGWRMQKVRRLPELLLFDRCSGECQQSKYSASSAPNERQKPRNVQQLSGGQRLGVAGVTTSGAQGGALLTQLTSAPTDDRLPWFSWLKTTVYAQIWYSCSLINFPLCLCISSPSMKGNDVTSH